MGGIEDDFFREFRRMQARMNALLTGGTSRPALPTGNVFVPPADVFEAEETFQVVLEIAGVDPDEIEVFLRDRTVFISGQRRVTGPAGARIQQMEIDCGNFRKIVELPCPVEEEGIESRYEKGMLILEFRKPPTCRIDVKTE